MSPEKFADGIAEAMPHLTVKEKIRLMDHGWAWAEIFYEGEVPQALVQKLIILDEKCLS